MERSRLSFWIFFFFFFLLQNLTQTNFLFHFRNKKPYIKICHDWKKYIQKTNQNIGHGKKWQNEKKIVIANQNPGEKKYQPIKDSISLSSIQSIEYRENRIMSNTVIYDYIVHTIVHTINFIIIAKLLFLSLNLSHILSRINNVISKMCLRVPEKKIIILSYMCGSSSLPVFFSDKFPRNILYMI